jgi:hypothetical protein
MPVALPAHSDRYSAVLADASFHQLPDPLSRRAPLLPAAHTNAAAKAMIQFHGVIVSHADTIGAGFAEAHHITSPSEAPKAGRTVSIHDFALVRSNSHSMQHRGPDFPSIEALRQRVRHAIK